ncbi:MAG: RNA polymerase sigma factor [candidate division Zixibacteria bacterium]|nr:RNA polymerase sigma factor [candidate division Zixibacteria bacterium]
MQINTLYSNAVDGNRGAEDELFAHLLVSFRLFVQQRVQDSSDREEIVQDALMTIAAKYREIRFDTSFAAWAYRVLNNKVLDYFKTRGRHRAVESPIGDYDPGGRSWEPDPALKARLIDCLRKVNSAQHKHARILNLHYQGFSTAEICDRLKLTTNYFYVMLSRARAALERCLETGEID